MMYRRSHKDVWFEFFEEELDSCLELGLTYEEAEHEASLVAEEKTQDYFDDLGDYLYEQQKDKRMELYYD